MSRHGGGRNIDERDRDERWQGHLRAGYIACAVVLAGAVLQLVIVGVGKKPSSIGLYEAMSYLIAAGVVLPRIWVEIVAKFRDRAR